MTTSESTELAAPAVTTAPAGPRLAELPAQQSLALVVGLYFLFFGLVVLVATLTDSLVVRLLRPFQMLLIVGSTAGMATGARQLSRLNGLGDDWRKRSRDLWYTTFLVAYLSVFYILWRRVPENLYFLVHALVFAGLILLTLCLLTCLITIIARAADRRALAIQSIAFGSITAVLLLPPFGFLAQSLVGAAQQGRDPLALLLRWLEATPFPWMLVLLLPFSLTLSLLWAAKDLVWEQYRTS